jgi:predicted MFS family arabinose efflux permease
VPVVGMLNQSLGFQYTFWILAILTIPGFLLTFLLPSDRPRQLQAETSARMEAVLK